jgi:hypothetical protein
MGTNEEKGLVPLIILYLHKRKEETNLKKEMGDSYSFRESDNAKKLTKKEDSL